MIDELLVRAILNEREMSARRSQLVVRAQTAMNDSGSAVGERSVTPEQPPRYRRFLGWLRAIPRIRDRHGRTMAAPRSRFDPPLRHDGSLSEEG